MDLSPSPRYEVSVEPKQSTDTLPSLTGVARGQAGVQSRAQEGHGKDAVGSRRQLVTRASDFLSRHAAEGVRISALARATGVSERTLRNAFRAEHGLSPKKFDVRERLLGARRALCSEENSHKTVTSIACEFGFYELGRFALAYKRLFGESPSATFKAHHAALRNAC
jgi:transcriptional regulator GlxA family with amidase domain